MPRRLSGPTQAHVARGAGHSQPRQASRVCPRGDFSRSWSGRGSGARSGTA